MFITMYVVVSQAVYVVSAPSHIITKERRDPNGGYSR